MNPVNAPRQSFTSASAFTPSEYPHLIPSSQGYAVLYKVRSPGFLGQALRLKVRRIIRPFLLRQDGNEMKAQSVKSLLLVSRSKDRFHS